MEWDKTTEELEKELKKIYWDSDLADIGFLKMAEYVQGLCIDACLEELSSINWGDCPEAFESRIAELQRMKEGLK